MATERRWVNGSCGNDGWLFLDGNSEQTKDIHEAEKHWTRVKCEHAAQRHTHIAGLKQRGHVYWHAVPVERETERTMKHRADGPTYVLRHRDDGYAANLARHRVEIEKAMLFTATGLWRYTWDDRCDWTPIPVEVTEAPGPWRVVEDE